MRAQSVAAAGSGRASWCIGPMLAPPTPERRCVTLRWASPSNQERMSGMSMPRNSPDARTSGSYHGAGSAAGETKHSSCVSQPRFRHWIEQSQPPPALPTW